LHCGFHLKILFTVGENYFHPGEQCDGIAAMDREQGRNHSLRKYYIKHRMIYPSITPPRTHVTLLQHIQVAHIFMNANEAQVSNICTIVN